MNNNYKTLTLVITAHSFDFNCWQMTKMYLYHRGLATGIYTTNSTEACHYVAANAEANILVVENQKQLEKILQVEILFIIAPALIVPVLTICKDRQESVLT